MFGDVNPKSIRMELTVVIHGMFIRAVLDQHERTLDRPISRCASATMKCDAGGVGIIILWIRLHTAVEDHLHDLELITGQPCTVQGPGTGIPEASVHFFDADKPH